MNQTVIRRSQDKGFALVVTLSLMILLTLVAVGLLSLSAINLRSTTAGAAQAEARANARLALMLAIGELQKEMGPDQRISAPGAVISSNNVTNPNWIGAWESWKAGPTASGADARSEHSTIMGAANNGMAPSYQPQRKDHFRSWLLSLNPGESANVMAPSMPSLDGADVTMPGGTTSAVRLLGKGTLGAAAAAQDLITARLLPVKTTSSGTQKNGRYGWWIGDESMKARLLRDSYLDPSKTLTLADKVFRQQAPASTGTRTLKGLENVIDDTQLKGLPSLRSLDLVKAVSNKPSENFHFMTPYSLGVLSDVREGGLKRDLSTILERIIDPEEVFYLVQTDEYKRAAGVTPEGNDFMLYRFDDMSPSQNGKTGEASVPIQDLAAYYQLYDNNRSGWKGGIQFSSSQSSPSNSNLTGGIMVSNPDYGVNKGDYDKYLRQTGALYRNVYPVKIEFVLSYLTEERTQAEMDADRAAGNSNPDTHKLRIGFTPAMTFWNPNNVPIVMNIGDPQLYSIMIRETPMPMQVTFRKHNSFGGPVVTSQVVQFNGLTNTQQGELYTLYVSGRDKLVFEPGESKVLALRASSNSNPGAGQLVLDFMNRGASINEDYFPELEVVPGWNPERFIRSSTSRWGRVRNGVANVLTFKPADSVSAVVNTGTGREFSVDYTQKSRHSRNGVGTMWHFRTYSIFSRFFPGGNPNFTVYDAYRRAFTAAGFPPVGAGIVNTTPPGITIAERSGQTLINSMRAPADFADDLPQAFFYYGMRAATETQERNNTFTPSGSGAARRFPARPFTHSTMMMPQMIDSITGPAMYNNGWNWFYAPLNNLIDAPVSISRENYGYFGGGYTAENGTTHVVQQELPVVPPISIAELSNAQLSGYSLGTEPGAAGFFDLPGRTTTPGTSESFRRNTALGFGGLEPRTLQAIGNSYAHPNIPKDKAITTFNRVYYQDNAVERPVAEPFADHSYLANKALWDDYFFSSITPVPASNPIFAESARTVEQVTRDFLKSTRPLSNRRMVPYTRGMNDTKLANLLANYSKYKDGFADKIASCMMVEGPFNINSTSENAWIAFFSSLRGKPVAYLDLKDSVSGSIKTKDHVPTGTPVGSSLANGKPFQGSSSSPSDSPQWTGWRELTDDEIKQLAKAMVKQVKLRGPFLSLSDYVNRRLDPASDDFSVMGALQAAIDDPACNINAGFRSSLRKFSAAEKTYASAVFPAAMEGPVAYGSSAYVDQADILKNFAEQITPRGDTFVVRAYGDSTDATGNVVARAWCEAVIQRVPEYVDMADEPQLKQANLVSNANKLFGRRLVAVSFRWLSPQEV